MLETGRRLLLACAVATAAAALMPAAHAQGYPRQPIRLIVPFAPGGAVDQTARIIGNTLGEKLGQTLVIDNKPGASGSLGAGDLHRAKPDGYTLMLALDSQAVNHLTVKNLPFDTFKDFDYLSLLVTTPQVLVTRNDLPAKNFDELVTYLKANPKSSYGSAGTASAGHVNSAQLSLAKGLRTEQRTTSKAIDAASKAIVALQWRHAEISRHGDWRIPFTKQALQGYGKVAPVLQRER